MEMRPIKLDRMEPSAHVVEIPLCLDEDIRSQVRDKVPKKPPDESLNGAR